MTMQFKPTRTSQLIAILGHHQKTSRPARAGAVLNSTGKQLTLYELGALIVVAGADAGFDVHTEYPVMVGRSAKNKPRHGNLDCAWFSKGKPRKMIVAWEIDAQDVGKGHLTGSTDARGIIKRLGNELKFKRSGAKIKIQALYSIRRHLLASKEHAAGHFEGKTVDVFTDIQLMSGQLLKTVHEAKRQERRLQKGRLTKRTP